MLRLKYLCVFILSGLFILPACRQDPGYSFLEVPQSRVIVLTDMLNEADDSQTMVRLLMYANRMDIEGLIAVSSCHQYAGKNDPDPVRNGVHPEEIRRFIDAYALIRENLELHEPGWPAPDSLRAIVGAGPAEFGMAGVGPGKSTSGSRIIERALLKPDPRPLHICINAGASCLAQALYDLQDSLEADRFRELTEKLRVYDDAGQDNAGAWIARDFPWIHYRRSATQVFNFYNQEGPVTWQCGLDPGTGQHRWARQNVQEGHGPLGALYPVRYKWQQPGVYHTLEGGGTSTWIGHVNHGLYMPEQASWGGWGGRFESGAKVHIPADPQLKWAGLEGAEQPWLPFEMIPEASDSWTDPVTGESYRGPGAAIYRWRRDYQNDFQGRMDWCLGTYAVCNHPPQAVVFGDDTDRPVLVRAAPASWVEIDASASSDPDGDSLEYRWYLYPEAGDCPDGVAIRDQAGSRPRIWIPGQVPDCSFHVILEVNDLNPLVRLKDYRRIIITVQS